MILSLLLLMGMQPCHRVGSELKNCGMLYGDFPNTVAVTVQGAVLNTEEWCGKSITLGKSSKKLSEIFPEECGGGDTQHGQVFPSSGSMTIQDDLSPAPNGCIDPCYEAPPQPGLIGDSYEMLHPSEPLDVPAIQVPTESHVIMDGDLMYCSLGGVLKETPWHTYICEGGKRYSCDPPTRILEHDEQPTPYTLYWCRKVQTK